MSQPINEVVIKALSSIESVTPKAWSLLVEAQRIEARIALIKIPLWLLFFAGLIIILRHIKNRAIPYWKEKNQWDAEFNINTMKVGYYTVIALATIICAAAIFSSIESYNQYVHADVYAAKALVDKIE
jgi:hypothetical protein